MGYPFPSDSCLASVVPGVLQVPLDRGVPWHDEETHALARVPFREVAFRALDPREEVHEEAHDDPWDHPCDEDAFPWGPSPLDRHDVP